ncbi:NAD(+)/NADH kinase [uncultured Paludibaculum sp.]|uniref:NAD(+)/NADH kinase n=1 Tax=uncultured Paludibaculum sp. TaxID=1765020 RepID=UPI002AAB807E|nr:NAD(+)/NADH kinase [uncultured Paludibaculum sp.]
MEPIRTVGIISKPEVKQAEQLVPALLAWLDAHGVSYRADEATENYAGRALAAVSREEVPDGCQLVIVLGGDGTLLSAARAIAGREIPLFAVNLGGLGFLTAISTDELFPELERALRNEHRIAKRRMLSCEVQRGGDVVAHYEALNDVVITKVNIARMIDLVCNVDAHFVCRYKADGLILSTPTGSTAYSLSAGGPIVFPSVGALCITPICPHTLTNRPVLVSDASVIQILNLASDDVAYLTIDGQVGEPLKEQDRVICRSSQHALSLIRPPRMLFFDVLRQKLKWGER